MSKSLANKVLPIKTTNLERNTTSLISLGSIDIEIEKLKQLYKLFSNQKIKKQEIRVVNKWNQLALTMADPITMPKTAGQRNNQIVEQTKR